MCASHRHTEVRARDGEVRLGSKDSVVWVIACSHGTVDREAAGGPLALLHAAGLTAQTTLLPSLLVLFPSVPMAFLRVWSIGRKGHEPRVALLTKLTHTRPQKNDCSKCYVYILILMGIALQKFVFCTLHGVIKGHLGARLGLI